MADQPIARFTQMRGLEAQLAAAMAVRAAAQAADPRASINPDESLQVVIENLAILMADPRRRRRRG